MKNFVQFMQDLRDKAGKAYEKATGQKVNRDKDGHVIGGHNNDLDAFTHAYTAGIFAMEYGSEFANFVGEANEWKVYLQNLFGAKDNQERLSKEQNMDLWNNAFGIKVAHNCKNIEELGAAIAKGLKEGELITNLQDGRVFENDEFGHSLAGAISTLESLFIRTCASNNFGRGTPPSAAPTAGPPTPSTPPTTSPTKGPSGTGSSPTSGGASSSNQAPFTKASSSPTRTYTHPSTTPINTPSFALLKTLTKSSIYYEKMVA